MKKLTFSIAIDADRETVWNSAFEAETYQQWTAPFAPGSRFEGSWETGAKIKFLEAQGNGMISEVAESRPHEFLALRHLGMIQNGVEDTTSDEVTSWAGALETYTFRDINGMTEVGVELDTVEEYESFMLEAWPKALQALKAICESRTR
ncbi:MAG: SRPBCC domain-containing protein [Fimbriimonadia bacterium]|nr:SRPBCC domain-containing protein [Fimbriimonadia bacterium]